MISCERDDICLDEITPHLTIRFYDKDDLTLTKKVSNIRVQIIGIEGDYTGNDDNNTITSSTDSILIPLRVDQDITKFILTSNSTNEVEINADTLIVNYTSEAVFVGRSCGYKAVFKNLEYSFIDENIDTLNWIKDIELITENIEDETIANVKIFH